MVDLVIFQGLPGAGKTTQALAWVAQSPWDRIRVNKDSLRAMLNDSMVGPGTEAFVIAVRDRIVKEGLRRGKSVCVDDTNLAPHHLDALGCIGAYYHARIEIRFVDTPLAECLARNATRAVPIPVEDILRMHRTYLESNST